MQLRTARRERFYGGRRRIDGLVLVGESRYSGFYLRGPRQGNSVPERPITTDNLIIKVLYIYSLAVLRKCELFIIAEIAKMRIVCCGTSGLGRFGLQPNRASDCWPGKVLAEY